MVPDLAATAPEPVSPLAGAPSPAAARFSWPTAVAVVAALVAVVAVVWRLGDGFDLTDESFYLQAADEAGRGHAFNGFFGFHLRPLWQLSGWSVAGVRLAGAAILVGSAALLGLAAARLLGISRAAAVALSVAGSTGYYGVGLRTPSYNWLAVVGATLACAAVVQVLAGARPRWGLLGGAGVAVAAAGKPTTGVLMVVVVVIWAAASRRWMVLAWAVAGALAVVGLHLGLLLGPEESLQLLRRSSAVLAAVDPDHYTLRGAVASLLAEMPAVLAAPLAVGLLGALPTLAAPSVAARESWFARHCAGTVAVGTATVLVSGVWTGSYEHQLVVGTGVLPLVAALVAAAVAARRLRLAGTADRRPAVAVAVLVVSALACAAGTNAGVGWLVGALGAPLLVPACLLACSTLPRSAVRAAATAVIVAVPVGAAVVAVEVHLAPKRTAPLAASTVPVRLGPALVRVDQDVATALADLVRGARAAGWHDGDPLVDTSFTPAVPLALRARVPSVLLPGFPAVPPSSVCAAVADGPAAWRDSWLLVPADLPADLIPVVAACVGRTWPQDYTRVGDLRTPSTAAVLWRPHDGR